MAAGKALLVVSHPGHELRLHGWLAARQPDVLVLTDGSGRHARSRIDSTRRVLDDVGAPIGPIFGQHSDQQLYRALLTRDHGFFFTLCRQLQDIIGAGGYRTVVSDSAEGYNPSHDLCRLLVEVAVGALPDGVRPQTFDFALSAAPSECPAAARDAAFWLNLDGDMLRRKIAAARNYAEMADEVEQAFAAFGADAFAIECLRPAFPGVATVAAASGMRPYYEIYGERQRQAGHYAEVIRYREHFLPVAQTLRARLAR